jgi:hypothetical protein
LATDKKPLSEERTKTSKDMKTNFLELTETLHQSLVDANIDDEQFNIIWSAINEVHSKLRITDINKG